MPRNCMERPYCGVRCLDQIKLACRGVEAGQVRDSLLDIAANNAILRHKTVAGHAKAPLRLTELSSHLAERLTATVAQAIEIPLTAASGDEVQDAIRIPCSLEHT